MIERERALYFFLFRTMDGLAEGVSNLVGGKNVLNVAPRELKITFHFSLPRLACTSFLCGRS